MINYFICFRQVLRIIKQDFFHKVQDTENFPLSAVSQPASLRFPRRMAMLVEMPARKKNFCVHIFVPL